MPAGSVGGDFRRALDGVRVLLVEDTDDARELLAFVLEQCAAVVTATASAAEALEAFLRDRPQIVVTDLAMPGHDGYWLLRQVREHAPASAVPAVALTAFTERYSREQALAQGFDAFLSKTIEPDELCYALRRLLESDELARHSPPVRKRSIARRKSSPALSQPRRIACQSLRSFSRKSFGGRAPSGAFIVSGAGRTAVLEATEIGAGDVTGSWASFGAGACVTGVESGEVTAAGRSTAGVGSARRLDVAIDCGRSTRFAGVARGFAGGVTTFFTGFGGATAAGARTTGAGDAWGIGRGETAASTSVATRSTARSALSTRRSTRSMRCP